MTDSTHTIFQSAKRFFSGTLLSRLSGMVRDISMAYAFGTEASIASFMVAYRLAHLCRRLFGEGSLQSAFIPEFESIRHRDTERAFRFFRDLVISLTLFLVFFVLSLSLGIGAFLTWGNPTNDTKEILSLTLLMLPSLLFICLFGLNASLLQCEKIYFTPAVAPLAFNCAWIAAVWILKSYKIPEAISWLALAVIIACFSQWLVTIPQTLSILKKNLSTPLWAELRKSFFPTDVIKLGKPFLLGMVGVMASQINAAIDAIFGRYAELEGPAFLWYAIRIQQLPLALFGIAIAGALLPPLTRALKAQNWALYYQFLNDAVLYTCTIMIPFTAALFVLGYSSVNLIFGHGNFHASSVIGTTKCLWGYGIGLLPSTLILLLAPACYAQNNYRLPAIASILNMILNFSLNYIFIIFFGWGATSVAVATSLSAWVNVFFLGIFLNNKEKSWLIFKTNPFFLKIFFITFIAFIGTEASKYFFHQSTILNVLNSNIFLIPFSEQLIELIIQLSIFIFFWISSCCLFGVSLKFHSSGPNFMLKT
ncbi:murein biosynthesis integral membrane protein MurJ [Candidatus Protochlamydia sp. W-9]|uniref:murein biosynthesis integral membrane protein MurJ n=1 Tax=Candidatus Protochlamydia sp. W-9 TaxID=1785087 RepID=UPI00096AA12B|nr:murein biosynthesis integral membrane protein MurJ [Candidatus Protochlamydia sp. W-9]